MSDAFASLPHGHFGCILADPPWAFRTFGGETMTPHRSAEDHYSTMDLDALKALPVGTVAARDCALFLWIVDSHIDAAIALGEAWGFALKTVAFIWLKERMIGAGQVDMFTGDVPPPRMSMGYWTRKQAEMCLLFTRGSPRRLSKGVRQVIVAPRREHSRKPDAQYGRIEALVGGPRLEIFARAQRPGWAAWGNQTDRFSEENTA
jgi:N6-adenosine-specific RNA methylase IME4